ncbi:MAG: hypothetical protein H5T68_10645 [Chloroflexi bacterium]|nr:hypothetical protein [Chloroflexota bacterium]
MDKRGRQTVVRLEQDGLDLSGLSSRSLERGRRRLPLSLPGIEIPG